MKKLIGIFSLLIVMVLAFSSVSYANGTYEVTVTSDVTSAKAGDTVTITVDVEGLWKDVKSFQNDIKYDSTKFSVDVSVPRGGYARCFESAWYEELKADNTSYAGNTLAYIALPTAGKSTDADGDDIVTVMIIDKDYGYAIDEMAAIYNTTSKLTAAKIKFTALEDVDVIDDSCFYLKQTIVGDLNDKGLDTTVNQIEAAAPAPSVNTVAAAETIKTDVVESQEPAGYEKGQGFALRFAAGDVANFTKMIWALTVDGAKKYSDAVAFNAAAIADDAQVEVAATFLNQNEAAVSAVNAIFCTEDGTEYFTDAADADNKAE